MAQEICNFFFKSKIIGFVEIFAVILVCLKSEFFAEFIFRFSNFRIVLLILLLDIYAFVKDFNMIVECKKYQYL